MNLTMQGAINKAELQIPSTLSGQALAFRTAMGQPIATKPDEGDALMLQLDCITEEFDEFMFEDSGTVEELKELADLVFVCYQYAALMGYDLDEATRRVFISNMSKLGDDGKPVLNELGKVTKGPNYQPPDLSDLI